jgi:hypothetical protein
MAQTGFTPIQLYSSSTTGNTPAAADLLNSSGGSELAINIFDGKLFYKDSSNAVQVIGWKVVPVSAGGTGATSASITAFNNITGYTATGATGTTSTNLVFSTSPTLVTPTIGVATATSINKMAITAPATSSTLAVADGKTFTVSRSLTLTGTDSTTMTFPTTSATIARTDAAQTFTGTQTFSALSVANIVGKTYAQTSTASPFSIVDTGIAQATANTGYGYQAVYEIFVVGNPYAVGSATYSTSIAGLIFISNGYNGASVGQYISFTQLGISTVPVFPPQLTMSVVFWDGSTESTFSTSASAQIRIKVSYTDTGNIGYSQIVNITKRV